MNFSSAQDLSLPNVPQTIANILFQNETEVSRTFRNVHNSWEWSDQRAGATRVHISSSRPVLYPAPAWRQFHSIWKDLTIWRKSDKIVYIASLMRKSKWPKYDVIILMYALTIKCVGNVSAYASSNKLQRVLKSCQDALSAKVIILYSHRPTQQQNPMWWPICTTGCLLQHRFIEFSLVSNMHKNITSSLLSNSFWNKWFFNFSL